MKKPPFARLLALSVYATALAVGAPAALAQTVDLPADHPYAASQPIPGRYIVVFKAHVANPAATAANLMRGTGGQLHHTYTRAIKGFAASLPDAALQGIRNNPNVDYIEQDQTVSLNETPTQANATWGLDRIDQRTPTLDGSYQYNYTGTGVHAFIIDTGIRATHTDFTGRVQSGYSVINDGRGTNDCHGHGTHVAGTVGGVTWGVAKEVSLIPVRVLNCSGSGTWSGVIAGVDWVANSTLRPAVANMSLGGSKSDSVNTAVAGAVTAGVTMVVAAGNSSADACNYSPASAPSAITVGATTKSDVRASYSNYGSCLDIFAPGSGITSAWKTKDNATKTLSGTSMASPHVAGVAALALAADSSKAPTAVDSLLKSTATCLAGSSFGEGSTTAFVYSLLEPRSPPGECPTVTTSSTTLAAISSMTSSSASAPGGSASCVTAPSGSCTLTSSIIRSTDSAKVTVTGVSGPLMTYDASQNAVTEIVIAKP